MTPIFPGKPNSYKTGNIIVTHKNHHEKKVILLSAASGLSLEKL